MSIFLRATKSGWYPQFLQPVVKVVLADPGNNKLLDIGTGPGTLPEMLIKEDSNLNITGIDSSTSMINEAGKRLKHKNVSFQYGKANERLPFANEVFDVVTFCSVLFLPDDTAKTFLLKEALRVLKPNGKIIILTPSGKKLNISAFAEVWQFPFSLNNWTFLVWKIVTSRSGRKWQQQKWLASYSEFKKLSYSTFLTFNRNASIEIINKTNNILKEKK